MSLRLPGIILAGRGIVTVALLSTVMLLPARAHADTITKSDGKQMVDVEITSAKWDQIEYKLGPAKQTIPGTDVLEIERTSQRLGAVRAALAKGDYPLAETSLAAAVSVGTDWEKAEGGYLKGLLYLQWSAEDASKLEQGITALNDYLKAYRDGKDFNVPHAITALGKAYLQQGNTATATEMYQSLAKEFAPKGAIWGHKSNIGLGWAVLKAKGVNGTVEANELFGKVLNATGVPKPLQLEATVGRAAVNNGQGQFDAAIGTLNKQFFESTEVAYDETYAAALNAMGDAYLGKKDFPEAELWFLKTTCWFSRSPAHFRDAAKKLAEVYKGLNMADRAKYWEDRLKR